MFLVVFYESVARIISFYHINISETKSFFSVLITLFSISLIELHFKGFMDLYLMFFCITEFCC